MSTIMHATFRVSAVIVQEDRVTAQGTYDPDMPATQVGEALQMHALQDDAGAATLGAGTGLVLDIIDKAAWGRFKVGDSFTVEITAEG